MKVLGVALLALVVAALVGACNTQSPALTPKPADYPCHNPDGSARPDATWCYPIDHTHTCCGASEWCVPNGCESHVEDGTGYAAHARRVSPRQEERP